MASCWVSELPPCTTESCRAFSASARNGAHDVDAEMLEEAPVLGGERRLDQIIRKLLERHGVVAQESALADLVAVAVVEGDAVIVGQVHLALRDLERRKRKGENDEQARREPSVSTSQSELVQGAQRALDLEATKETRIGAPPILEPGPGPIEARVDRGIDGEPIDQLPFAITL